MTIASLNTLGGSSNKTAGTSFTHAVSAQADSGNLVLVAVAANNFGTSDGDTSELSITDASGNTYVKIRERTNAEGATQAGATVALFYSVLNANLVSGGLITCTLANSVVAKAMSAWEFSRDTTAGIAVASTAFSEGTAAAPASISLSGLTSQPYLFIAAHAGEGDEVLVLYGTDVSGGYTALDKPSTTSGAGASNMFSAGGFLIATGTGETYDATTTLLNTDHVQIFAALNETQAGWGGLLSNQRNQLVVGTG